ncbi:MAG: alpha/beta hydrolase [Anaerorhabdus sp.]
MNLLSFFDKKDKNIALVCIHGFGRSQSHEYDSFKIALPNYNIIAPNLYNLEDETDDDWARWLSKAERVLDQLASEGKSIYLIGYSMGGVIATYFSNKPNVKKLVLLAPAFEYITLANALGAVGVLLGNKKKEESTPSLPQNFTLAFTNLVNHCKDSAKNITIPTLMIHGSDDPTISPSTSRKYFDRIPAEKKHLCIIEGVEHHILSHETEGTLVTELIRSFIEEKF